MERGVKGHKRHWSLGLYINTQLRTRQRQKRIPRGLRGEGEPGHHLSALGNSSSDWDTNASISYRHIMYILIPTCTVILIRYKRKGYSSECVKKVQNYAVDAKFPSACHSLQDISSVF